jgi:hypothetical protein
VEAWGGDSPVALDCPITHNNLSPHLARQAKMGSFTSCESSLVSLAGTAQWNECHAMLDRGEVDLDELDQV